MSTHTPPLSYCLSYVLFRDVAMRLTIRQIDAAADDGGYDMPATQAEYNEGASPQPAAAPSIIVTIPTGSIPLEVVFGRKPSTTPGQIKWTFVGTPPTVSKKHGILSLYHDGKVTVKDISSGGGIFLTTDLFIENKKWKRVMTSGQGRTTVPRPMDSELPLFVMVCNPTPLSSAPSRAGTPPPSSSSTTDHEEVEGNLSDSKRARKRRRRRAREAGQKEDQEATSQGGEQSSSANTHSHENDSELQQEVNALKKQVDELLKIKHKQWENERNREQRRHKQKRVKLNKKDQQEARRRNDSRWQHGGKKAAGDRRDRQRTQERRNDKNICQHFLRGTCKFGRNCRREHPSQTPHAMAKGKRRTAQKAARTATRNAGTRGGQIGGHSRAHKSAGRKRKRGSGGDN